VNLSRCSVELQYRLASRDRISNPGHVRIFGMHAMRLIYQTGREGLPLSRVCIPRLAGMPVIFHSGIPGNGTASFPTKTGMVQLMALLPF